jgi:hypothetical protein
MIPAPMSLLAGTRMSTKYQERNAACPDHTFGCAQWLQTSRTDVFIGDVENATILVQHAVAPAFQQSIGFEVIDTFTARPPPRLYGSGGSASGGACEPPNCIYATACAGIGEPVSTCPTAGDIFRIDDLLKVTGVDLDAPVTVADENTTLRYSGMTMRVNVEYESDGYHSASYAYRVSINRIEAKAERPDSLNMTTRLVNDVHGVQLIFQQTGGIRLPDFRTAILTLVSGLVMLGAAKTVADYFLLYAAPRRADYRLFVLNYTPDFGPDNEEEEKVLERILEKKRQAVNEVLGKAPLAQTEGDGAASGLHEVAVTPGAVTPHLS